MANVTEFRAKSPEQSETNMELNRLAIRVAAILPGDLEKALAVLIIARQIVTEYLN